MSGLRRWIGLAILLISGQLLLLSGPQAHVRAQEATGGMLAVVGVDGNLSVYDANGKNPVAITTDAILSERLYQWPTWATDGRLAFFGASNVPTDKYSLRVFVQRHIKAGETYKVAYSSTDEIFTYPYWAPGDCGSGDCRDLALLYTPPDQQGLAVRLIRDDQDNFSENVIGRAAPFYFSFSPDGKRLFWHQNSDALAIYDIQTGKTTDVPATSGQFNAPMWSPADNRLLYATEGTTPDKSNVLIGLADQPSDAAQVLIKDVDGPLSFAWSPDATMVATLTTTSLSVTDVGSGKTLAEVDGIIVADFWSPQSDRIAYITVNRATPQNAARFSANGASGNAHSGARQQGSSLQWYILDVKTGKSTALSTFLPTRDMIYYLNFSDQFARSHSLWSPDGHFVSFGVVDSLGNQSVMIADTRASGDPIRVASGSIGIWSWN